MNRDPALKQSDIGRVVLASCLDQLRLQSQGFILKYTGWPQESWWGASSRTSGLYKEETSLFFLSTWMILVDIPRPKSQLTQRQTKNLAVLDTTLTLNFEAAEQSSLEIRPEIEQKGHYYIKRSAKPIHTAANGCYRGAEMSRFEHMPKAMPHTQKGLKGLQRPSASFNCFRKTVFQNDLTQYCHAKTCFAVSCQDRIEK